MDKMVRILTFVTYLTRDVRPHNHTKREWVIHILAKYNKTSRKQCTLLDVCCKEERPEKYLNLS